MVRPSLYVDANIFVMATEAEDAMADLCIEVLTAADRGQVRLVTSELTIAEVLVHPIRDGNLSLIDAYERQIRPSAILAVIPVTTDVLRHAAALRAAEQALKLPDAIHAATAALTDCHAIVTNDRALRRQSSVRALPVDRTVLTAFFLEFRP